MSSALAELRAMGITLAADGDSLTLRSTTGAGVPREAVELARQHKPELLAVLSPRWANTRHRIEGVLREYCLPLTLLEPILAHGGAEAAERLHGLPLERFVNIRATRELHDRGVLHGCWAIPSVAHLPTGEVQP
ncbi:hypothetical protein [Metallibacterium sp.]|jgi:hypothetical protein|uniref:hypothetical protein n=1 Tax=Metallibacterium sp. TaxID=2940281 RepID=UPI002635E267|nr:hypothetical protein [Metallibacterium sp.]